MTYNNSLEKVLFWIWFIDNIVIYLLTYETLSAMDLFPSLFLEYTQSTKLSQGRDITVCHQPILENKSKITEKLYHKKPVKYFQ